MSLGILIHNPQRVRGVQRFKLERIWRDREGGLAEPSDGETAEKNHRNTPAHFLLHSYDATS